MPQYRIQGTYKWIQVVTLHGDEAVTIDTVIDAESEEQAKEQAIDDAVDNHNFYAYYYEEVDWDMFRGDDKGLKVQLWNPDDPAVQAIINEQTMRALGPDVAPPLLEGN